MSEHGVFSGYNGMTPRHHMAAMPKPVSTKTGLHAVENLPGVIHTANSKSMMPSVSKIVGSPQKNASVERGMYLERVKPSATKATPGMIQLEMR